MYHELLVIYLYHYLHYINLSLKLVLVVKP